MKNKIKLFKDRIKFYEVKEDEKEFTSINKEIYEKNIQNEINLNLFEKENNHILGLYGPASGYNYIYQSIFLKEYYKGTKITILDIGDSYKHFSKLFEEESSYINFKNKICLNPFSKIDNLTKIDVEFITNIISGLSSFEQPKNISQVIEDTFKNKNKKTNLQDILDNLDESDFKSSIEKYFGEKGYYYYLFNGENTLNEDNILNVYDLEEITKDSDLLYSITNTIIYLTYLRLNKSKKNNIFLINEAWHSVFTENQYVSKNISLIKKALQKKNISIIISGYAIDKIEDETITENINKAICFKQTDKSIKELENTKYGDLTPIVSNISNMLPYYIEFIYIEDIEKRKLKKIRYFTIPSINTLISNHPFDKKGLETIDDYFEKAISEIEYKDKVYQKLNKVKA